MIAIPSRHKSLVLLAGVVIVQMLFLAVQIKRDSQGRLIRSWTVGAISPFERTGAWGFGRVRGIWTHYFALQNTSRENEDLRRENDALKLQLEQLRSKAAEADRLAPLINFRQLNRNVPMLGARVIGASADTASHTIFLDRGERVVTSGMDRIFPKDLPVGTVTEVKPGNPFKLIRVRPAANLERLEEVIVLLTLHPLELHKEPESRASDAAERTAPEQPPTAKP